MIRKVKKNEPSTFEMVITVSIYYMCNLGVGSTNNFK